MLNLSLTFAFMLKSFSSEFWSEVSVSPGIEKNFLSIGAQGSLEHGKLGEHLLSTEVI